MGVAVDVLKIRFFTCSHAFVLASMASCGQCVDASWASGQWAEVCHLRQEDFRDELDWGTLEQLGKRYYH